MQCINNKSNNLLSKSGKPSAGRKRILVLSKGWFHPSLWVRRVFRKMLLSFICDDQKCNYEFYFIDRFKDFIHLGVGDVSHDRQYDGVILFMHENKVSVKVVSEFLKSIQRFLSQGGGLLAVHGAIASFKSVPEYGRILGSRFTGHDAACPLEVRDTNGLNTITLKEELYMHDFDQSVKILWYSRCRGKEVPVAWAKEVNGGRVFCFSLGHYASTFQNEKVKNMVGDALAWITGQVNEL